MWHVANVSEHIFVYTRIRVMRAVLVTGLRGRGGIKTLVGGRSISTRPLASYIIYMFITRPRVYVYIYIYLGVYIYILCTMHR